MDKTVKNSLLVILIIVILFCIIWLAYDIVKEKPVNETANANLADENTGLDNIINILFDNNIANEQIENTVKNDNEIEKANNKDKQNAVTGGATQSVTTREEKAVELVKKEWGTTDGVYFSNESIDSEGRYIVSVRNKKTTASLMFYLVDVDKELVTEQ